MVEWDQIEKEWSVITQAPTTFGIAFLLMGVFLWWLIRGIYKHSLEMKEDAITNLERKLLDCQQELEREKGKKHEAVSRPPRKDGNKQTLPLEVMTGKPLVPVIVEFNPEDQKYFRQGRQGDFDPQIGQDVWREYICTVVNTSDEPLTNVSWEVERVVWQKDRPNDHEYNPENIHEKLRYDLAVPSTKIDFNGREREKLCLFSRLKKASSDNEPVRIMHSTVGFHDRKRLMTVFIKVTASSYEEKHFSLDMWVHDGLLRMTGIRPE